MSKKTENKNYFVVIARAISNDGNKKLVSEKMLNELYILMRKHRLTDLAYKNVHFTKEGKIAIIDTGVAGCNCFNFTKQLSPELQE